MNEHKQRFAKVRAAFERTKRKFKNAFRALGSGSSAVPTRGYSGDRSRPHVVREPNYLHVSRPLIVNKKGEVTGVAPRGTTYHRTELRRHELRKLKKRGLDLTGGEGTRALENLL